MSDKTPLEIEIRRRIAAAGPMPVDEYMGLCLADPEHGYYTTRDPLGARGDFMTAPDPIPHFDRLLPQAVRAAPAQSIYEWRADGAAFDLGRRVQTSGGAALVIDYGHVASGAGDTLQAVGQHAYADPLIAPGAVDLTAHVDFAQLLKAAEAMGAISGSA